MRYYDYWDLSIYQQNYKMETKEETTKDCFLTTNIPDRLGINCGGVSKKFEGIVVETSKNAIESIVGKIRENDIDTVKGKLNSIINNTQLYTRDELLLLDKDSDDFKYWCGDVLLYVCSMIVLTDNKFPIPAVDLDTLKI